MKSSPALRISPGWCEELSLCKVSQQCFSSSFSVTLLLHKNVQWKRALLKLDLLPHHLPLTWKTKPDESRSLSWPALDDVRWPSGRIGQIHVYGLLCSRSSCWLKGLKSCLFFLQLVGKKLILEQWWYYKPSPSLLINQRLCSERRRGASPGYWWCRLTVVSIKRSTTRTCDQERGLASTPPFTAPLRSRLNFHMEQEGELMLHRESCSLGAAANSNQVRRSWSSEARSATAPSLPCSTPPVTGGLLENPEGPQHSAYYYCICAAAVLWWIRTPLPSESHTARRCPSHLPTLSITMTDDDIISV